MDHDVKLPSSKSANEMDFTDKDALNKLFKDFIDVQVQDLNMDLSMSTITGLTDLIEDEIVPIPIPLQVSTLITLFRAKIVDFILTGNPK